MEDVHTETCTISPMGTFSSGGRVMNMDQQKAVKKEDSEDEEHVFASPVFSPSTISSGETSHSVTHVSLVGQLGEELLKPVKDEEKEEGSDEYSYGETSSSVRRVIIMDEHNNVLLEQPFKEEEPGHDNYLYCEDCKSFFIHECEVHGPALFIYDTLVPMGVIDRARQTLPPGLGIRKSGIPEAGLGVFNEGETILSGAHFGPYQGDVVDREEAMNSVYSWVIYKSRQCEEYIDAKMETRANWMRYVNCARRREEKNLIVFQYQGGILYRCCQPIKPGQELLVWYEEEYAKHLSPVFEYLWNKKSTNEMKSTPLEVFSCSSCPFSYTSQIYLHKHMKRCHYEEYVRLLKSGEIKYDSLKSTKSPCSPQITSDSLCNNTGHEREIFPPLAPPGFTTEDFISKLKQFSKLDFQSKQEVINKGRPTPELKGLVQTTGQKITRSFQTEWYARKDWLCGCPARNRLFCFPCLLFSTCDNVWTQMGYCDMRNLQRSLSKHERSTTHIQSQIALKTFGISRIDLALDEQRRLNISLHNAEVKENREILKDLINATCFLAKQHLAFRANDESTGSANRGNYVELLHAFAEKDDRLARHLETSTVFSGFSSRMQNDLIEAISEVITNDIKKEISAAPFVAVEVDETTDVTHKAQISVILRYVAKTEADCQVKEAFLGFDDVSADRRAPAVAEYVLGVLEKYNCVDKLVAQTYDGAVLMASELRKVQAKIKEKVPEAMFTPCYAHELNLVLLHSARCMPESLAFFKTAEGLGAFFSKSTKRAHLLDDIVQRRFPRAAPTRWSSNSRLLQTISVHQNDLRALFHIILENPDSWDDDTLMMAAGYDRWLSKTSTCFLLTAYERIFNETDALFRVLQNKVMDVEYCLARIRDTVAALGRMRLEFDSFYERFEQKCGALGLTESGNGVSQAVRDERRRVFWFILDSISDQMKVRFDHFGELAFLGLVDCAKFREMSQHFDETKLQSLSKYAKFFDFERLKADLVGLYSSQTVRNECKSPGELLNFLAHKDLIQTVPEATKFLQLVLTVPALAASVERSSSALKRIKTYNWNRTDQGRLSSLAVISVEMERLLKLKQDKEDFYNKVTDIFVQKDRRMDFIYK